MHCLKKITIQITHLEGTSFYILILSFPMEDAIDGNNDPKPNQTSKFMKAILILLNCTLLSVGQVGGPLLVRLYYLHGGSRRWLTSWLLTAGFPILIFPITISYLKSRTMTRPTRKLVVATAILGCLLGLCSYLYSFGMSYLPVSVSSLLGSTQLAFTAVFAYVIVKHKFSHYSVNSVVLMTFGSVMLGLHMDGDRLSGVEDGKYALGFMMTLGGAALHGFLMPAVEYTQLKAGVVVTFDLLMQLQFLILMFATLFCTVPMIINGDFQAISREATEFDLGETKYYTILTLAALGLQFMSIGSLGLIFCSSSLFGGIVTSLLVPVQQIFAVIFLPESFNSEKSMALAMCLWGFASYFYGEYRVNHNKPAVKEEPAKEFV